MTDARVTQVAAEVITGTTPPVRVTQLAVEVVLIESEVCSLADSDGLLLINAAEGSVRVDMDVTTQGRIYYVARIDDSDYTVTLDPSPLTIDGLSSITLEPGDSVALTRDDTTWWRL